MKRKLLSLLLALAVAFNMASFASAIAFAEESDTPFEGESIAMSVTSVGGVNYYYTDGSEAADDMAFTFSVTTGRGASAVTTYYSYMKADLTQIEGSNYYYIANPKATPLGGTLYGYGEGTATTYREFYESLGIAVDESYDAVSSATNFTSHHAGDIPSNVIFGTDAEGNKTITSLNLGRAIKTVDAAAYVEASILKAAGVQLTGEQAAALDITLKVNPMKAPSEGAVAAKFGSAEFTKSKYGTGTINIYPDDTVEGYVWSEYLDSIYAATISDGTNTAGAVYWIDLYGEKAATPGYHYNKVEFELNNGLSKASNAAVVNRYAAFFDEEGYFKPGTYTVNVYAEGYETVTGEITIDITLADKKATYTGKAIEIDDAVVSGITLSETDPVTYTYYSDAACTKALDGAPTNAGTYYVRAEALGVRSKAAKLVINKKANKVKKITPASKSYKVKNLKKKKATFALKATVQTKASVTWKVTKYYSKAKKYISVTKAGKVTVKKGTPKGTYKIKVKATTKALTNVKSASLDKVITIKVK